MIFNNVIVEDSSCGQGTKAVIKTQKSINEWRIRMSDQQIWTPEQRV